MTQHAVYITVASDGFYRVGRTTDINHKLTQDLEILRWWPVPNTTRAEFLKRLLLKHGNLFSYLTWEGIYPSGDITAHLQIPKFINEQTKQLVKVVI